MRRGGSRTGLGALLLLAALGVAACGGEGGGAESAGSPPLPQRGEHVDLDPAEFTTEIDNPYLPMTPGDRRVYRVTDPEGTKQRAVATVTGDTRRIANGITARVVYTAVSEDGEVVEDNHAWYAQDGQGNVWYLGERARELENREVKSTKGSWEAGVDGAQPGVVMAVRPEVGLAYRQEHYPGVAEDRAEVFSLAERAEVPLGKFRSVLLVKETEGIERALLDYKFYARGVGQVLGIEVSAGSGREELISYTHRRGGARAPRTTSSRYTRGARQSAAPRGRRVRGGDGDDRRAPGHGDDLHVDRRGRRGDRDATARVSRESLRDNAAAIASNVDIVRCGFEAFNSGDVERLRELMTEDMVSYRAHPDGATYHGFDGFVALVGEWVEDFSEWSNEPTEYIEVGENVVTCVRQSGRGEVSGAPVEADFWFAYEFRDGRISALSIYATRAEALAAAGRRTEPR